MIFTTTSLFINDNHIIRFDVFHLFLSFSKRYKFKNDFISPVIIEEFRDNNIRLWVDFC